MACHNHRENVEFVKCAKDFENVPPYGCMHDCEYRLDCGHACRLKCHSYDQQHTEYKCLKPCARSCEFDHPCHGICWEKCSQCMVVVERTLTKCEHTVKMKCHVKEEEFKCENPCIIRCSYDHLCNKLCWQRCGLCKVKVSRLLPKCQHMAEMFCHEEPWMFKCQELVEKTLSRCQHTVTMLCHENEITYGCRQPCRKFCESNHPCSKLCYEFCGSCETMVEKH